MKKKKTSPVKKKVKKAPPPQEAPSVLELAKLEKNMPAGERNRQEGKQHTREVFRMWCVLPDTFKGKPERITELLGITDNITIQLLAISTMQQFADEFGVIPQTLSRWRKDIETGNDYLAEVKRTFKPLTKNLMASLYRKGLEEGDAQRMLAYMKIVEDWREQLGIEHPGDIGEGLTEEERKAIDHLIQKNTAP
jgi:transposase-like protein